jgi:hypothetical protein
MKQIPAWGKCAPSLGRDSTPGGIHWTLRCSTQRARAEGEEMRAARLKEMEEMAVELVATARKLPPSQERHEVLQEIRNICERIDALKAKGK